MGEPVAELCRELTLLVRELRIMLQKENNPPMTIEGANKIVAHADGLKQAMREKRK